MPVRCQIRAIVTHVIGLTREGLATSPTVRMVSQPLN